MMHHASHPLPLPLWVPSWPDVPAFAKPPDPSWFACPSNPYPPPRRRPYHRLEQTAASPPSSRAVHSHSSRARAHRAPPALSALPALPISLPMPALERECRVHRFGMWALLTRPSQRRPSHLRMSDRRCQRRRHSPLRRSFSMWCAMRHCWHPSRFHTARPPSLTVSSCPIRTRISRTRPTRDRARSESGHETVRMASLPLLPSDAPPRPCSED